MLVRIFALCFSVSCLACSHAQPTAELAPATVEAWTAHLDTLEAAVFANGLDTDTARARPYVRAVQAFAEAYPTEAVTAEYLMNAAGIANGTQWANKAIQLWGYVWRKHPEHPRAPEAMFYQGFVMDTQYKDYPLATKYYDRLLETYPNHPLAEQAAQLRQVSAAGGKLPPVPSPPGN